MIEVFNPLPGVAPPNAESLFEAARTGHEHGGWDENEQPGVPVYPVAQGRVLSAGDTGGIAGLAVALNHGQGYGSFYCHLSGVWVKPGDTVKVGQPLGGVGATGNAEAPHLHFQISQWGRNLDPAFLLVPEAADVEWAQKRLALHGYQPGPADGWMGPRTAGAIRHFQVERGLLPSGAADPRTVMALKGKRSGWPHHPADVERWRPLVVRHWTQTGQPADYTLSVMWAESRGNPNAVNSTYGASGLFQHLPGYWQARSAAAGWAGADIMEPETNIAVAAWLFGQQGWGAWEATGTWPPDGWSSQIRWLGDHYGTPD